MFNKFINFPIYELNTICTNTIKIIFKTIGKVFSNADNANTTATVVKKPSEQAEVVLVGNATNEAFGEQVVEVAVTESPVDAEEKK